MGLGGDRNVELLPNRFRVPIWGDETDFRNSGGNCIAL